MAIRIKDQKGYSGITSLSSSIVDTELYAIELRGFINMYYVVDHLDHTHYFIELKKGVDIKDTIFNNLFAESYSNSIKLTKLKDFIEYMHCEEEFC